MKCGSSQLSTEKTHAQRLSKEFDIEQLPKKLPSGNLFFKDCLTAEHSLGK